MHCDYGHAYLTRTIWPGKEIMTTAFPLDFFYILVCAFLFVYFTSYCCSCYEGALKKIDQMWSEYHFFIFSRILVQINAKEFSENSWETLGFSRTGLLGNFARSREYKQYRKQKKTTTERRRKNISLWGDNNSTVRFFSGKVPLLGTGSGASEGRVGESQT